MATYKRRIVYLSDEEWAQAELLARSNFMSISAYFRSLIVNGRIIRPDIREEVERKTYASVPTPKPVTRTFSVPAFTPVPKPAPRKKR